MKTTSTRLTNTRVGIHLFAPELVKKTSDARPETAVLLLSSWRTFENLLSDPEIYGFRMEVRKKGCGESDIWVDLLHTTPAIARDAEDPSTGTDGSTAEAEHRVDSRAAEEKIGEKIA